MNTLKKVMALAVILIGVFAFSSKETKSSESNLNLAEINVIEVLSKQHFECRPSSEFMFYVETNLVKKVRGANNINAKIYLLDRISGKKNLLADENIQVNKFKGSIALQKGNSEEAFKSYLLENGDKIIGGTEKTTFSFNELIKYQSIYNSYLSATNKLLGEERSI